MCAQTSSSGSMSLTSISCFSRFPPPGKGYRRGLSAFSYLVHKFSSDRTCSQAPKDPSKGQASKPLRWECDAKFTGAIVPRCHTNYRVNSLGAPDVNGGDPVVDQNQRNIQFTQERIKQAVWYRPPPWRDSNRTYAVPLVLSSNTHR